MKKYIFTAVLFLAFFTVLAIFALVAEGDAQVVRERVFRFHIIGASNSDVDQQNKLAVRDGIAKLCSDLFGDAKGKADAMDIACDNSLLIKNEAEAILEQRGCDMPVTVDVGERYFPTRSYDGVTLPAGVYDTLDIRIGEASGENFWCVMFPDICVGSSSRISNSKKMGDILPRDSEDMVLNADKPIIRFKFKAIELLWSLKNLFFAQK